MTSYARVKAVGMKMPVMFLVLATLISCSAKEEPTYKGVLLTRWIALSEDNDPSTRLEAIDALGNIGIDNKAVLKVFEESMHDDLLQVRVAVVSFIMPRREGAPPANGTALKILKVGAEDPDPEVQLRANWGLYAHDAIALDVLIDALEDNPYGICSLAESNINLGPSTVEWLGVKLMKGTEREKQCSATLLKRIGGSAVPVLLNAVQKGDVTSCVVSAEALVDVGDSTAGKKAVRYMQKRVAQSMGEHQQMYVQALTHLRVKFGI